MEFKDLLYRYLEDKKYPYGFIMIPRHAYYDEEDDCYYDDEEDNEVLMVTIDRYGNEVCQYLLWKPTDYSAYYDTLANILEGRPDIWDTINVNDDDHSVAVWIMEKRGEVWIRVVERPSGTTWLYSADIIQKKCMLMARA